MTTKRYFLLRCFPEPGTGVPKHYSIMNPAVIKEITRKPVAISEKLLEMIITDPLERAVVMTQGIIGEYEHAEWGMYIKRAWRVKKKGFWFVRGHQLRIP